MMGKEDGAKYNPIITEIKEPKYFRWRAFNTQRIV